MELIGLLAIGIVIGIPVIAIVAVVRRRVAERRIEEKPAPVEAFVAAAVAGRVSPQKLILGSSFSSFRVAVCCIDLPRRLSHLALPIWNSEGSLRRCSLPVLVLHCENDRLFLSQMALRLASIWGTCKARNSSKSAAQQSVFYRPLSQYWDHVVSILVSEHAAAECLLRSEEAN